MIEVGKFDVAEEEEEIIKWSTHLIGIQGEMNKEFAKTINKQGRILKHHFKILKK